MKSSITKRIMAGIVCAMVAVSICGCSEKPAQSSASESSVTSDAGSVSEASDSSTATGTAAEITAKIQEDVKFPGMAEIGADRMAGYYDVAADKIDSYSAYICGSGAYPDEIAVFKMKSADAVNAVKSVLEKRVGFKLAQKDVFLNIAGGLKVNDPAIDLAVISAILSSNMDAAVEPEVCMAGEIGLSGEIRPVNRIEQRIGEAEKLGFKRFLLPKYNLQGIDTQKLKIELVPVRKVEEAFRALFG